jgi:hypothetical protein
VPVAAVYLSRPRVRIRGITDGQCNELQADCPSLGSFYECRRAGAPILT